MIETLRKSWVALGVLTLALIAQIPHAAYVFDAAPSIGQAARVTLWYGWLLAYAYAIALESATLMFVVHNRRNISYGFALASFLVNLSYYAMHGVTLFSVQALPVWLLSALLPIAIASYSHIFAGAHDDTIAWGAWIARARNLLQRTHVQPIADDEHEHDEDEPDNKALAQSLATEGLTRAQIGERLGVHPSTVGRWLNGRG